jgi:O-antigen/teichoic acid export membrane protein
MAAWAVVNADTSPIACLVAAATHLRNQTICSALAAVMNLMLTITMVQSWGLTGVMAATVMSYLVFICVPILLHAERLLSRLRGQAEAKRSVA